MFKTVDEIKICKLTNQPCKITITYTAKYSEDNKPHYCITGLECENINLKLKNNDVHCTCDDIYSEHHKHPVYKQ